MNSGAKGDIPQLRYAFVTEKIWPRSRDFWISPAPEYVMSEMIRYRDRTWSFVGAARTRANLLKPIGEAEDGSVLFAETEGPGLPRVVFVPKGEGVHELFRLSGGG